MLSFEHVVQPLDPASLVDDPLAVTAKQETEMEDRFLARSKERAAEERNIEDSILEQHKQKLLEVQETFNMRFPKHEILSFRPPVVAEGRRGPHGQRIPL